ncbi:FAD-binding and (Fe-S)-binding domain-containing protein [Amycolatopsis pithecellobii]|uniref:D-lactate dehydrogenase (cytochrome) n=1 Tax=Amycolatopsis pithecellobii TaxID=664692 RepID=A0A6N7Z0C5_9PSEU|nr:FAD-binding and (Fe-S)-binding domain-containing protein [Amycolatopsis pithecellobii]MTD53201.1 FAD-binding protein [Amycolatopsis pithecellobii]
MVDLGNALRSALGDDGDVRLRALDRHVRAADASHFLLTPQAVVVARDAEHVGRLMRATAGLRVPLTFRAGGTSLSGQGVTDGVLVDVRTGFRELEVLDEGRRVRVQPGLTLRQVNARLAAYGRRLGPDPASEAACTVGGVVANNSSGMACGTVENCYRTVESLVLVLPSGRVVDTGARDADERLRALEPRLYEGLLRLRDRVRGNPGSLATVARQFAMKNTMGYGVNSYVDFDTAARILAHLAIGSEGTLAFVAEATFRTIPVRKHVASGLAVFRSLADANRALPALIGTGAATIELLDATSLRVAQTHGAASDVPAQVAALQVEEQAALLVEYQAGTAGELAELVASGDGTLADLPLTTPVRLDGDPGERAKLWKLRKGLYASVAGARPPGTTALLEDIVVPVGQLADTCESLRDLFRTYDYRDSVIFGHAKDGNVHFMLTDRFESEARLARYHSFTEKMVDLVLGHGGSLKAEHGTGRVMAPYVRRQYGDELYDVMRETKRLLDPDGILNPGVVLNDDPAAHLKHLKLHPRVEEEVDRCVECGFCEPVCPSKDLTLTPRQRIVARRAAESARRDEDGELVAELEEAYRYDGLDTCAADGMCQTACPVHINTGDLVKRLRRDVHGRAETAAWTVAAKHWSGVSRAGSLALSVAAHAPSALVTGATDAGRAVLGADAVPRWTPDLPAGGRRRARPPIEGADALYLPACVGSMFGSAGLGVQVSLERLCERAGLKLAVPQGIDSLCCGTPWSSKGFPRGYEEMRARVIEAVTSAGQARVISDATSCTEGFTKVLRGVPGVRVEDAVVFVAEQVLPRLPPPRKLPALVLHPTCSSAQLGVDDALLAVARVVAEDVHVPVDWGCCAFAGDRGMLHPELTAAATAPEAREVVTVAAAAHASCNRTCELGMTRATGQAYRHVLELLEEITRAS